MTIPSSVDSIGLQSFMNCSNLKSLIMEDGTNYIGKSAFEYCKELEDISLSKTLKHIDEKAFYYCSNLKNIDIPQEVETIGKEAFSGCHFQSIYVHWLEPIDINTNVFSLIFYGMPPVLYIPKGTMDAYQSAEVWKEFTQMVEIDYSRVTSVKDDVPLYTVYGLNGNCVMKNAKTLDELQKGLYIVNGKKLVVK